MTAIASHRGGALLWPENSRIAFENTARLAVQQVEFDIHPSRDGRLVVIHDATLDRTTDATGPVASRDWSELAQVMLKATGGQRPLLLDEVIDIFRPTPILLRIEIKADQHGLPYPGLPGRIAAALDRAGMAARSARIRPSGCSRRRCCAISAGSRQPSAWRGRDTCRCWDCTIPS